MAIHLIEQNLDKIEGYWLFPNPNAVHLIEKKSLELTPGQLSSYSLLLNPGVFEIDYLDLQQRIEPFKEELIAKCFHPNQLVRYLETYNYDLGEEEY